MLSTVAQPEYSWVKDHQTGRTYKKRRSLTQGSPKLELRNVINPQTGEEVQMLVPVTPKSSQNGNRTSVQQDQVQLVGASNDRASSYLAAEDRQGKDSKIPSIVQYARNCPVAWTSKVTSDRLNMGLWCWAYIAELLAAQQGTALPLQTGVLEARMQHFLNVLEIALQSSNSGEYDGPSWKVARLYAEKVQQKVDRGSSWIGFEQRYGSDTHPHELMAAQTELGPKLKPKEAKDMRKNNEKKEKLACTTWNSSEVESKCRYEVENEGRECNRKHECSWCKDKFKKSLPHQRSFCRQRINAGEQ